jgi:hypothetical protein
VIVLAVDQAGEAVARVAVDALPHVQHRAAGRVDDDAPLAAQRLEVVDRDAERGQDDDVGGLDAVVVEPLPLLSEEVDHHLALLGVDVGVVDDLAGEEDPPLG